MSDDRFPFPFFGAGEATYFEWAEVAVRFTRVPNAGEQAKILEKLPPPLGDNDEPWSGADLLVGSDQFAHVHMAEHYEADEGDEPEEGHFFFAAESQVRRFNADIEAWLNAAHAVVPILVAYRHEDGESGGTELSAWHQASVPKLESLLPALSDALDDGDGTGAYILRGIIDMALAANPKLKLPEPFATWHAESAEADEGDDDDDDDDAGDDDDDDDADEELTADALLEQLEDPDADADGVAGNALDLAQAGQFADALRVFDVLMTRNDLDLAHYCNALWVVQADNNHLPVDAERARRYLAACLPHAPENPPIHFNAAFVYMELGDHEHAIESLRHALDEAGISPAEIRKEPMFKPLAEDPRFVALFERKR